MQQFPINLAKALLAVQGELRGVVKDSTNPHFKNRYASLEGVIDTIRPVLQTHGVVFLQAPGDFDAGVMHVTTSLIHAETGEAIHSSAAAPVSKQDPQGVGSAITYLCRYSLMAMLGLPPVDDDAEEATKPLPKAHSREIFAKLDREIAEAVSIDQLKSWGAGNAARVETLPADWKKILRTKYEEKMGELKHREAA